MKIKERKLPMKFFICSLLFFICKIMTNSNNYSNNYIINYIDNRIYVTNN